MKTRRIIAMLVATIMAATMLAGCATKDSGGTKSSGTTPSSKTESKAGTEANVTDMKAEIKWWAFPTFATVDGVAGKYEESVIAAFNVKYPNIKVNLETIDFTSGPEKITTAIQGNTAPDIIFDAPGRIISWGKDGVLADLNDLFTDDYKKDVGNENIVAACGDGTNYWMYPLSVGPFLMAYNKTILEKEGLMNLVPTDGERSFTLEQFTKVNEALASKGYKNAQVFCSGQGGDQGTRAFVTNLYGSSMTDSGLTKYTINDANGVKAIEYIVDQVKKGNLENGSASNGGESIDAFCSGTVTSTLLWAAGNDLTKAEALEAGGVEVLALPLPSESGKPNLEYLVNGLCVFDNGDANKVAASKEFVKFLCDDPVVGPQNVKATNVFPARQSFGDQYPGDANKAFYASMSKNYGVYYNTIDGFASMRPAWFANLQAVLAGDKDPKKAMDDFVVEADKSIADAK